MHSGLITAAALALAAFAVAPAASAQPGGCPPGLAKKSPACVPPGLARKGADPNGWRVDDLDRVRDPGRYRLPPLGENQGYYRDGRIVYRVDERTRQVLDWVELTADILGE
jgi:hypothetical protein